MIREGARAGERVRGSGRMCCRRGRRNIIISKDFVDSTVQIEPMTTPTTQLTSEQGSIEPLEMPNSVTSTRSLNSHDSTRVPIVPTTQRTTEQNSTEPTTSGVNSTTVVRRGLNTSI